MSVVSNSSPLIALAQIQRLDLVPAILQSVLIPVGDDDGRRAVLGFASDYCIEGQRHGTSVYVRGHSARQGIGSALLAKAEAHAIETGATSIEIEASLAGMDFYRANGFIEVGRGETRLTTARSMECVFMRKELSAVTP